MARRTINVNPIQNKLVQAVCKNNTAKVSELLNSGADVNGTNKYGMTPLVTAVSYRSYESAKVLLESGADPNLGVHGYVDYGYKLPTYNTPLHLADWETDSTNADLAKKAKQMVRLLKKFGANE
jgi:ankyrin repeat protein